MGRKGLRKCLEMRRREEACRKGGRDAHSMVECRVVESYVTLSSLIQWLQGLPLHEIRPYESGSSLETENIPVI